jgi:hypothetical protein
MPGNNLRPPNIDALRVGMGRCGDFIICSNRRELAAAAHRLRIAAGRVGGKHLAIKQNRIGTRLGSAHDPLSLKSIIVRTSPRSALSAVCGTQDRRWRAPGQEGRDCGRMHAEMARHRPQRLENGTIL